MKNNTECHLLMHTACMSGNFLLWFMSQHDGFMHSDIFPRNTLIDKFWGDKADEPLHFAIEDHNLWKGAIAKSANTSIAVMESLTQLGYMRFSLSILLVNDFCIPGQGSPRIVWREPPAHGLA